MANFINNKTDSYLTLEDSLRNFLINQIVIFWTVMACVILFVVQFRTFHIGFALRDLFQYVIVGSMIILSIFRNKFSALIKGTYLIFLNIIVGIIGIYTLGVFTGGVHFFPTAIIILALFYSKQCVYFTYLCICLFLSYIVVGFTTGEIELIYNANYLLRNFQNWLVYVCALGFCMLFSGIAILNYRKIAKELVDKIQSQKNNLIKANMDLSEALKEVKSLRSLLPICSNCKKIRNDKGYWVEIESYIRKNTGAEFTHSICNDCIKKLYPDIADNVTV